MKNALIGHTGFVGGNLLKQQTFTDLYNSKNITSIHGQTFDQVICAGVRAEKWKANQDPAADWAAIERLIQSLDQLQTKEFILISTIDVYPDPVGVDESAEALASQGSAYGKHRRQLEEFVQKKFSARIVRLPGLYGSGLKKNILYDFLHDNLLDKIHADSHLQYYGLNRLSADIETMRRHKLALVNLVTEPVAIRDVAREAFGRSFEQKTAAGPARYDVRTQHASLFGGQGHYLEAKSQVLANLKTFVQGYPR